MMRLPCPWCGLRDYTEFSYGGAAGEGKPADPDALDNAAWSEHLYARSNPLGDYGELWQHAAGCRRWIVVRRNTLTHEVPKDSAPPGSHGG